MTSKTDKPSFLTAIRKSALLVNQKSAGAGIVGFVGFLVFLVISILFLLTENFFLSMFVLSIGLLVYSTGLDFGKLMTSVMAVFISSRHLIPKAATIQDTLIALKSVLTFKRTSKGEIAVGPIEKGAKIVLPDNPLVRDLQKVVESKKDYQYAEYVTHSYFIECHELYDYAVGVLEFVANAMPMFGLIGTVIGLIGMFDGLGADVNIEALAPQLALALKTTLYGAVFSSLYKLISKRFDTRLRSLEYDYETLCKGIETLMANNPEIEIEGSKA